jgi:aspartyl-tRNA(Asn)/glutamyl-tRNA(Gln) amidotransferase subunit A
MSTEPGSREATDAAADVAARLAQLGIHPSADELPTLVALRDLAAQAGRSLPRVGLPPPDFPPRTAAPRSELAASATPAAAPAEAGGGERVPWKGPSSAAPFHGRPTLGDLAAQLERGDTTSERIVGELLELADTLDGDIGAYLCRFDEPARAAARRADRERRAGGSLGALHGLPIAVKDIIATAEAPTTAQSRVLAFAEAFDAACVARLRRAGAIILGKTTLNEHATGPIDRTAPYPIACNPWDRARWPGGSSSGSAAGVAAGLFPAAIGTDTGGSVRIPAAVCGLAGFKPTLGAVDTTGVAPLSWSSDTVGPLATTVADCALLHRVLSGTDATARLDVQLDGLRVGVDESWADAPGLHPDVPVAFRDAVASLEAAGAKVTRLDLSAHREAITAGTIAQAAEAFEQHHPDLASRWEDYGANTRPYLVAGGFYSAVDYVRSQRVRTSAAATLGSLPVDVYVSPTVGVPAPLLDDDHALLIPLFFTAIWNAVGFPALSVPMGVGRESRLPLGMQIAARPGDDLALLAIGSAFERCRDRDERA